MDLIERIRHYNKGRDHRFLHLKYEAMAQSAFRFFRGTAHLFYQDIPKDSFLWDSPKSWICGDLHLENLGSFKGDNRLAYFDMNDFDEACLAPCLLDITRFACSVHVGSGELGLDTKTAKAHVKVLLERYAATLLKGYIRVLEKETATGVVKQFLEKVENRKRSEFLRGRVLEGRIVTSLKGPYVPIGKKEKAAVKEAFQKSPLFKRSPDFFAVRDVAFRIAGTGSLGMERYVMLVGGNALIDIKEAQTASLLIHHHFRQPAWPNQAERIIEIQQRVEAAAPALLSPLEIQDKYFVVKELQPMEDKLDLTHLAGKAKRCLSFVEDVGELSAWGSLRSSGRQGSAISDDLIAFAAKAAGWKRDVADYAAKYAARVRRDYAHFLKGMQKGLLNRR